MKAWIDPPRVATAAVMLRQQKYTVLLVEGLTDDKFYRNVTDPGCRIVIAEGKRNVQDALAHLDQKGVNGVVGVVDVDYDWALDRSPRSGNLVTTPVHDLETLLMLSPALDRVLNEYGDAKAVEAFQQRVGRSVREACFDGAYRWGLVRLYGATNKLRLDVDAVDFADHLDADLQTDIPGLTAHVAAMAKLSAEIRERLERFVTNPGTAPGVAPPLVCQGHDLVGVLCVGLNKIFGNGTGRYIGRGALQGALRLACPLVWFADTELYRDVKRWEERNPPHRVFVSVA